MKPLKLSFENIDKKFIFCSIIALILVIISGIVLCILTNCNIYLQNYAKEYVCNVYNFANGTLIISLIIKEAVYLYICFCIAYFTRRKYFTLPVIFIKYLIETMYIAVFFTAGIAGGFFVSLFVYIPMYIITYFVVVFTTDSCKKWNRRFALFMPAVAALADCIIFMIFVNVIFRVIIAIV